MEKRRFSAHSRLANLIKKCAVQRFCCLRLFICMHTLVNAGFRAMIRLVGVEAKLKVSISVIVIGVTTVIALCNFVILTASEIAMVLSLPRFKLSGLDIQRAPSVIKIKFDCFEFYYQSFVKFDDASLFFICLERLSTLWL
jgi:hypothetical protein